MLLTDLVFIFLAVSGLFFWALIIVWLTEKKDSNGQDSDKNK